MSMGIDITPLAPEGIKLIDSYGEGRFKVAGEDYDHSIIVFHDRVLKWDLESFETLSLDSFAPLVDVADQLDMVLLGCGARSEFVKPALRQALKEKGIIIDFMDTGAACRTHNFLLTEGRRVASALIVIK